MITSIASQKGGTGKTTTAISLSAGLARNGQKVLLVDLDSQANASDIVLSNLNEIEPEQTICATLLDRKELKIRQSNIPNLDVVPSHILLSETDMRLASARDNRGERLKNALDAIKDDYDHIILDLPPSISWQTLNGLIASDNIIIVVTAGLFSIKAVQQIGKTIEEIQHEYNKSLEVLGFLFTQKRPTNDSKESLDILRDTYPHLVFKTVIPQNTDMNKATLEKKDIFAFDSGSTGALSYFKLLKELKWLRN